MKRGVLNLVAVFALLLTCTLGFVACGKKAADPTELTVENLVAEYETTHCVLTIGENQSQEYTKAEYLALVASNSEDPVMTYLDGMFAYYNVKADGKIYTKSMVIENAQYNENEPDGTWTIENGKLSAEAVDTEDGEFSAEWNAGKVIVTVVINVGDPAYNATGVLTLEKVAA